MKLLFVSLMLLIWFSAPAAELKCSIHPAMGIANAALQGLAKIKVADAKNTAVAAYKSRTPVVSEGELVIEDSCLVYTFDIRFAGMPGAEDVIVDAGTGVILSQKHVTPKQEAAEADAMIAGARKH